MALRTAFKVRYQNCGPPQLCLVAARVSARAYTVNAWSCTSISYTTSRQAQGNVYLCLAWRDGGKVRRTGQDSRFQGLDLKRGTHGYEGFATQLQPDIRCLLAVASYQASAAGRMRSSFFWDVAVNRLVVTDISGQPIGPKPYYMYQKSWQDLRTFGMLHSLDLYSPTFRDCLSLLGTCTLSQNFGS